MARKINKSSNMSTKVKKDSTFNYIVDTAINKATDGVLDKQTANFQISYNKILSETHKKEVFQIVEFPTFVPVGHLEKIREELLNLVPIAMRDDTDIHIVEYDIPNFESVSDKKMTRIRNRVNAAYSKQKSEIEFTEKLMEKNEAPNNLTYDDLMMAKVNLRRRKRLKLSFSHAKEHRGARINTYIFLELTTATVEQMDIASDILKKILATGVEVSKDVFEPYIYEQITTDLYDYIMRFGIASLLPPLRKKSDVLPFMTLTSNVNVIDESFKPGIIRSKQPKVYLGHLLGNNYMYHINFSGSTDASNLLLVADSGSGKTVEAMTIFLWLISDKKQHIIINDYKGNEWDKIVGLVDNSVKLSFNTGNPTYINTYKILDYKVLGFNSPRLAYQLSAHITAQILVSLCDPTDDERSIITSICSDIVNQVYGFYHVDPIEPQSYHLAEQIDFPEDTWRAVDVVTNSQDDLCKKYKPEDRNRVRSSLSRYFEHRGDKRGMFEHEIDITSIFDAKVILIDYSMQTTGGAVTRDRNEYGCWLLQKFFISSIYCGMQKAKNEYSVEFHEEVAQQFKDKLACEHLCRDITGNRSFNKTNILLTNTLGPLVNPKVNTETIEPVKENLNMFMLGRCKASVVKDFISYIDRPELLPTAKLVARQNTEEYVHSFMFYQESGEMRGSVVLKTQLPDSILNEYMKSRAVDTTGVLLQTN